MITIQLTSEELKTIEHGLYLLEDQSWFTSNDITSKLLNKLNLAEKTASISKEAICDI